MKRYLPFILFVVGFVLLIGVAFIILHGQVSSPAIGDLPQSIAGFALADVSTGDDAVVEIQNLHLGDFQVDDAVVAAYGTQNVVLWAAQADSDAGAQALLTSMDNAILDTDTPFSMLGVYQFSGREVRSLDGLGQLHFYFQSGSKVVWLATDAVVAEQSLQEVLRFYP